MCVYSLLEVTGRRKRRSQVKRRISVLSSNREILRSEVNLSDILLHAKFFFFSTVVLSLPLVLLSSLRSNSFVFLLSGSVSSLAHSTHTFSTHTRSFFLLLCLSSSHSLTLSLSRARAQWFRFLTFEIIFLVPFTLKKTFFSGPFFFLKISTLSRISFARSHSDYRSANGAESFFYIYLLLRLLAIIHTQKNITFSL